MSMDLSTTEEEALFRDSVRGTLTAARKRLVAADAADVQERWAPVDTDLGLWQEAEQGGWLDVIAPASLPSTYGFAAVLAAELGRAVIATPVIETAAANAALAFGQGGGDGGQAGDPQVRALALVQARGAGDLVASDGRGGVEAPPEAIAVPWAHAAGSVVVPVRVGRDGAPAVALASWSGLDAPAPQRRQLVLDHDLVTVLPVPGAGGRVELLSEPAAAEGAPLWDGLAAARLLRAWEMLGSARAAVELTTRHVSSREQFGRTLASMQAVQLRLANMWLQLEAAELLAAEATWLATSGGDFRAQAECATFAAGRASEAVTQEAAYLHGGVGYMWEYDLHWHYRRVKAVRVRLGTTAQQLEGVAGEKLAQVRRSPYPTWPLRGT